MKPSDPVNEYLAKAVLAEEQAARCKEMLLKDSWLKIALSYRSMAQRHLDGQLTDAVAQQPSPQPAAKPQK